MVLYGTLTSPYVRRVRVLALERGLAFTLRDTSTPEGQQALEAVTPILRVPVAELDGQVVFDSRGIQEQLWGPPLRPLSADASARVAEQNLVLAVDEALDSLIRRFYFARDGVGLEAPYLARELRRAERSLAWVASQLRGPWCTAEPGFGRAELALSTALEWMRFRRTFDVDAHPALQAFVEAHAARPSLAATRAPGA